MIDYHAELVRVLSGILPTHYELQLTQNTPTPCISYMETANYDAETGDTLGYSWLGYQVKVWGRSVADLQKYAQRIDAALRPLGWERTACFELADKQGGMIQKIMTYEGMALENY